MNKTNKPSIDFVDSKRTKILATVGPATDSFEAIVKLIEAGVNGLRVNFSHANYDDTKILLKNIRKASKQVGKPVAILQDLQGPKIRLGLFEGVLHLDAGSKVELMYDPNGEKAPATKTHLPIQIDLSKKVKTGERLFLVDGSIRSEVVAVGDGVITVKIENDGIVMQKKGINLPDTDFGGDVITKKDKKDIEFGATQDFDYLAQSFVQSADDIVQLRKILKKHDYDVKVVAKIETRAATENLEQIVEVSDGVMVARGDLAYETPPESVPVVQRKIIGLAQKHSKLSIVATQMLGSMTERPEPTRAEVSDVATATIVGADAVMLSEETAMGKYPIEAVKMMKRIILYTQNNSPLKPLFYNPDKQTDSDAISTAIITLAHQLDATAIVAQTKTGATATNIASLRPTVPIVMITSSARVQQQLALVYGGKSYLRPDGKNVSSKLTAWLKEEGLFKDGDIVISAMGQYPGVAGGTDTIKVRTI